MSIGLGTLSSVPMDIANYGGHIKMDQWITEETTISKSKKQYAHFDVRTDISKCGNYISDPRNIVRHGFYPFIHYEKKMIKYNHGKGKKEKTRDICYAAHIDRCIYQLYSHILNDLYNDRVKKDGIESVGVAYRTDLHTNNIQFAKTAIDFIREKTNCYIMIGDFTGFFDNLDHTYLKQQWCNLMGVQFLPEDHYAVFKNITAYSKWERDDLLALNGLPNTKAGIDELNAKSRVLSPKMYSKYKSYIKRNSSGFGIPQGSPISGLLANVYMLNADKVIHEIVTDLSGMYMRYSDDFIIILPQIELATAKQVIGKIQSVLNTTQRLKLEPDKTQYFYYKDTDLVNCGKEFDTQANCEKNNVNFLGFTFDGKKVSVRAKTTGKYYYKMYRKAKTITNCGGYTHTGRHISCKNLYEKYSERGASGKKGNYLTYINRAQMIFGDSEDITRDTKRHMSKIRKALKKK